MTLANTIKAEIAASGLSLYRICKETGMNAPTLQRFVNGERDLTLGKADLLCDFFDLRLVKGGRRKP